MSKNDKNLPVPSGGKLPKKRTGTDVVRRDGTDVTNTDGKKGTAVSGFKNKGGAVGPAMDPQARTSHDHNAQNANDGSVKGLAKYGFAAVIAAGLATYWATLDEPNVQRETFCVQGTDDIELRAGPSANHEILGTVSPKDYTELTGTGTIISGWREMDRDANSDGSRERVYAARDRLTFKNGPC